MRYVYLSLAILAEVTATLTLKNSAGFTHFVPGAFTAACYASAFYFLSLTLREMPTGLAYAIWSGAGIVLIASASAVPQSEKLGLVSLFGMALIIVGILIVSLGE